MKIAAVTDDGKTISMHFGQAQYYLVLTVENGQVVNREMRPKAGHGHGAGGHEHGAGGHHGPEAENLHTRMASAIEDCEVVLAGGMGRPAYQSVKSRGIEPIITNVRDIDEAVQAYLNGTLQNLVERLH